MLKLGVRNLLQPSRQLGKLATAYEALEQRGDTTNLTFLKNGLRVASYTNNKPTATVGVWVNAGSRHETNENNGVATVFEHMAQSGSNNRNSMQLQKDLARMGANLKTYTSREHSAFLVECLSSDLERVVDILADVLCNTKIDQAKLEEQRANAIKRLEDFEDSDHQGVVMDYLHMTAFQGTPMALSPMGNTKAIGSLTIESVKDFVNDILQPCRMVLACAGGGLNHDSIHKKAENLFGHLQNHYNKKMPDFFPPTSREGYQYIPHSGVRFTGSEFLYRDDNFPYMYGAIAVEGVPRGHLDYLPLEVAKTYVGSWDRTHAASVNAPSPVIQKSATNEEIMGFEAFNLGYDNAGLFGASFVLKGHDLIGCQQAVRPILHAWRHLAIGATNEDVDRAKNALKTNLFSQLETNTQLANYVAAEVLSTNKITPLDELERKIHYIDVNVVNDAMSRQIYDREIACAGIGKVEAYPIYNEMRYAMSWWRL